MTANLPAKVEDYTALQAQTSFTGEEKKAYAALSKSIRQHTKETIWWYWDLGQQVIDIHKAAKASQDLYGKRVLFRMAKALGYQTDRTLRNAMEVCVTFGTKKEFTKYVKLNGEAGNALHWSHLVYLAGVGDADMRMSLAAATLEQCWSAQVLWDKVKELCDRKARGRNQPQTKIPTSVVGCLTHVQSQANKFVCNFDDAWTGDAFDLPKLVSDLPADKLSDKLLGTVRSVRSKVVELHERAIKMTKILHTTEADIETRMAAQAQLVEEQAAELAEAAGTADTEATPVVAKKRGKATGKKRAGRVGVSK